MPDYMRRYTTDHSTSSRGSRQSDESSRESHSTAPTSIYNSPRPSIHQYQPERPIYYQKESIDLSPSDISPIDYPRSSQETYASTSASQEDLYDEPESYDPEYDVPEYKTVVESNLRPSNAQDFARYFPSTKRLYIRHDDTSYDGNMNLRVDTEDGHGQDKEIIQLFHLRMHDLKNREFSLRRYERSSGREVCHSSRKYAKPTERRPSVLTRSVSSAFASMRKPSISRQNSTTSPIKPMGGVQRHDSGYASNSESDSDVDAFMASKKAAASSIPTNTTKLEFSNYAQIEVKRRGAKSQKRYEFEYWGYSYSWKRVVEKDGDGKAISYHLFKGDSGNAVAHIVPELRSREQVREEELVGGWVPPCQMWISEKSVLEKVTDVADVIISTGLIALVDDSIKRHFQPKQLGFFSLDQEEQPQHRFLGLWYMEPFAVVWVANRNNPLYGTSGFLNLSSLGDLQLFDGEHKALWSSSSSSTKASKTANNPLLKISCSGNLISSDGEEAVLWQSFDYPMNTILAGMKLGKNFKTQMEWSLSSWKTLKDPSPGDFTLSLDTRGLPQLILRKNGDSSYSYRLGSWNGLSFTGAPAMGRENSLFDYKFTSSAQEVNYSWTPRHRIVSRLVLNNTGKLHRFIQSKQNQWILANTAPEDECDYYSICGAYAVCGINSKNTPSCSCLQGFKPKSGRKWNISRGAYGCVHEIPTNCEKKDAFVKFPGLKLPDTSWSWYDAKNEMTLEDCKIKCSSNCSCTAYANTDIREGGKGCLLWFGDLVDMREYSSFGQDVYIRMGFAKIEFKGREVVGMVVGSVVAIAVVLVVVFACFRKKIMKRYRGENFRKGIEEEDLDLPIFDRKTISIATDDFSYVNFLGRGGFGPVYKGKLEDGQEIAVKRLSANSGQGVEEFKNEVKLIAKLQHRNLVRLLGCCIQGEECMLIYEYMPNKSLDFFIFDERRSTELDWKKRMNIINGVARGILYLHQDSRLRIIHRDLKAGNVLLDNDMNPKISDFGLAKSFGGDQSESSTNRVVGTYGYMPPEYAIDGHFSVKSDVFSFGVLVLEIITGKTNRGFRHADHDLNLLGHVWKMWVEDREIEVPEEEWLEETSVIPEVLRCIHVALLCVQQKPEDRPTMASVVLMFGSDSSLPHPTQPGFFTNRNVPDISSSLSLRSQNEVSITMLQGR